MRLTTNRQRRHFLVEYVTALVAFGLVAVWVLTHYVLAITGYKFDENFLAQLGNMAMLALGVLGISKVTSDRNEIFHVATETPEDCPVCGGTKTNGQETKHGNREGSGERPAD